MNLLCTLPVLLAAGLLGAHFVRFGQPGLLAVTLAAPLLLLIPRRWAAQVLQWLLITASAFWLVILFLFVQTRQEMGLPWIRLAVILVAVSLITAAATLVFHHTRLRDRYRDTDAPAAASTAAFLLTAGLLAMVQLKVPRPMLLLERFWPGFGWLEILGLATYAAWMTERLLEARRLAHRRAWLWGLFSAVFFTQLILGLFGLEKLLMTGDLHLPVPAMIVGGPLYRGEVRFMPILFGVTILLTGPAWCSYLCYIGAWDNGLARRRRIPATRTGRWQPWLRVALLGVVAAVAIALRLAGASWILAALLGGAFGLVGVALMVFWSRRTGTLSHCTWYCPMGLLATVLGKLSPHRIRLTDGCDACGACTMVCRYDALSEADIQKRRPGLSCTLCGDCLGACKQSALEYRFPGLSPATSKTLFITLVVSFHAVCLAVARI